MKNKEVDLDKLYMNNLLISLSRIKFYCKGLTEEKLDNSPMLKDALCHNIKRVGRCVVKISDELKSKHNRFPTYLSIWDEEAFSVNESELWEMLYAPMSPLEKEVLEDFEKIYDLEYNQQLITDKKIKKELPLTTEHKYSTRARNSIWTVKRK